MWGPSLALACCPLVLNLGTSFAFCAHFWAVSLRLIFLEPKTGPGQCREEKPSRPRTLSLT